MIKSPKNYAYYNLNTMVEFTQGLINILNKQTGQTLIYSAGTWVNKFINVENLQELSLKDNRNRLAFSLPLSRSLSH